MFLYCYSVVLEYKKYIFLSLFYTRLIVHNLISFHSWGRRGGTRSGNGRGRGAGGRGRGNGRGGGRGRGRKDGVEKSAEELDKELETYHAEAMNIS